MSHDVPARIVPGCHIHATGWSYGKERGTSIYHPTRGRHCVYYFSILQLCPLLLFWILWEGGVDKTVMFNTQGNRGTQTVKSKAWHQRRHAAFKAQALLSSATEASSLWRLPQESQRMEAHLYL